MRTGSYYVLITSRCPPLTWTRVSAGGGGATVLHTGCGRSIMWPPVVSSHVKHRGLPVWRSYEWRYVIDKNLPTQRISGTKSVWCIWHTTPCQIVFLDRVGQTIVTDVYDSFQVNQMEDNIRHRWRTSHRRAEKRVTAINSRVGRVPKCCQTSKNVWNLIWFVRNYFLTSGTEYNYTPL